MRVKLYYLSIILISLFLVSCDEQIQTKLVPIKDYYTLKIKSKEVLINGDTFELNAPVIEVNGSTYIPLRFFAERFNAENLAYEKKTEKITFSIARTASASKETIVFKEPEIKKPDPLPEIVKKPILLKGIGQTATDKFTLTKGLVTFKMNHSGEANFAIVLLDSEGKYIELLVNKIGSFDGSKAVRIEKTGLYLLDISADGDWTITIE